MKPRRKLNDQERSVIGLLSIQQELGRHRRRCTATGLRSSMNSSTGLLCACADLQLHEELREMPQAGLAGSSGRDP
jgi:hypothetical protein